MHYCIRLYLIYNYATFTQIYVYLYKIYTKCIHFKLTVIESWKIIPYYAWMHQNRWTQKELFINLNDSIKPLFYAFLHNFKIFAFFHISSSVRKHWCEHTFEDVSKDNELWLFNTNVTNDTNIAPIFPKLSWIRVIQVDILNYYKYLKLDEKVTSYKLINNCFSLFRDTSSPITPMKSMDSPLLYGYNKSVNNNNHSMDNSSNGNSPNDTENFKLLDLIVSSRRFLFQSFYFICCQSLASLIHIYRIISLELIHAKRHKSKTHWIRCRPAICKH